MPNPIHIRQAAPDDTNTITAFNLALALETEDRRLDGATLRDGVRSLLVQPQYGFYIIAEQPGGHETQPVGQLMITYEWSDWRNGVFWWIQSVYVIPEQRGRGVYQAMHRHITDEAKNDSRICGIRLYVAHENERAHAAYRRAGLLPSAYDMYEHDFVLGPHALNP
ncbi:MAG: GNAT family N-acetyltransferase [Nitrospira sp.]|nr:GNAT family N-acetyltransferase [Nitrospira sp.]